MKRVILLDDTLRDGSYVIDFQFTREDTAFLCTHLERCGITQIEVGHGLGLGATRTAGRAAEDDLTYIRAAKESTRTSKIGVFFIPGVGNEEDLRAAADTGLDFIRIGADVTEIESTKPFIELAARLGISVTANFMKSYVLPPREFAEKAAQSRSYGSELIYLVDSAGGMLPWQVREYIETIREVSPGPVGFHGHNNLGLAMANSLEAYQAGADIIDCTLMGIGRDTGNAVTELIVGILENQMGIDTGVNLLEILNLGNVIRPLLENRVGGTESMALGIGQIHSSFLSRLREYAQANSLNLNELILDIGEFDKVEVTEETMGLARKRSQTRNQKCETLDYGVLVRIDPDQKIPGLLRQIKTVSLKRNLKCKLRVSGLEHGGLARSIRVEGGTMMLEIGLPEFDDALLKELLAYPFMAVEVDSVWRQQVGGQPCPVHFFDSPRHTVDASE